jgi:hypothetical protein
MENMKTYTFYRESNNFDDILSDKSIKKYIFTKMRWSKYLVLRLTNHTPAVESYIALKYGDEMKDNNLVTDRTPKPFIDYTPKEPKWLK